MLDTTPNHPHQAGQQRPVDHTEHAAQAQPHAGGNARPVRQFRMNRRERIGNALVSLLARAGIGPMWLLTIRGRKTGRPRTNPVVPVEQDGGAGWSPPTGPCRGSTTPAPPGE